MKKTTISLAIMAATLLLSACGGSGGGDKKPGGTDTPPVSGGGTPPPAGAGNPPPAGGEAPPAGDAKFFLPTAGEVRNTVNPKVEADSAGNLHFVYPTYAVGDAFYAYCASDCDADAMASVKIPTEGTVNNAMLAIGPDNKPQLLLSTAYRIYYATCVGDCSQASSWSSSVILEHDGKVEVSGDAFAITPDGKPRFMMHSYRALFGIGAPPPAAFYVSCESECSQPEQWTQNKIADEVWQENDLHFTTDGQPRLATVLTTDGSDVGAYLECNGDCKTEADWTGIAFFGAYSDRTVEMIDPAISLDLTVTDQPRVLMLGKNDAGKRNLSYYQCDADCALGTSWQGGLINESDEIGAGLDLVLDSADRPRFVYTADSNILLAHCDERCAESDEFWRLSKVEFGGEMKPDEIIPYTNCTVGAWFLRDPDLALGADGLPRVAYRAEDISGGTSNPDPTKPGCVAGLDMTFARFSQMGGLE